MTTPTTPDPEAARQRWQQALHALAVAEGTLTTARTALAKAHRAWLAAARAQERPARRQATILVRHLAIHQGIVSYSTSKTLLEDGYDRTLLTTTTGETHIVPLSNHEAHRIAHRHGLLPHQQQALHARKQRMLNQEQHTS